MEKITFKGVPNCYRLANDAVELVVSTDFGPRVLAFGLIGKPNVMGWFPDLVTNTEFGPWKAYGGHRLWIAPELIPNTYAPDSDPVEFEIVSDLSIRLTNATNAAGFLKEMLITLEPGAGGVTLQHTIVNHNNEAVEAAIWTPTIMDGGAAVMPVAPHKAHGDELAPSQSLILWPYTNLSDSRVQFRPNAIALVADLAIDEPNKVGMAVQQGWAARLKDNSMFVKRFAYDPEERYAHRGTNCEFFTKNGFLEVESLGQFKLLAPGESLVHIEKWEMVDNVATIDDALAILL